MNTVSASTLAATLAAAQNEPWTEDAICPQIDTDLFFPEKGGSTREAKSICARCPVTAECLEFALRNGERFGIWGGLSERERRRLEHDRGIDRRRHEHRKKPIAHGTAGGYKAHQRRGEQPCRPCLDAEACRRNPYARSA
jgi:WhiB family redox-sensing transcriptional regulator